MTYEERTAMIMAAVQESLGKVKAKEMKWNEELGCWASDDGETLRIGVEVV